ncbi:MAG: DUF2142 domain-containing protein [Anaerolineaceae bacterium]|nr:DUF2142 domain-containing protein [Anaerolineaceae bacterium]
MNFLDERARRKDFLPLVVILGVFAILCLIYTWATPPLEASDELWHFGMINTIADNGQLPVQHPGIKTAYEQEGSQPPLYYLIAAILVKGIDRSDFDVVRQPNPHAVAGVPGNVGNKNLVLHDLAHPPIERTVLAVYFTRLFSIILGCVTVNSIYMAARALGFGQPALPILAASLTAFNPMFLFITASVNNDNLVTALNSLIIWQMIVLIRRSRFSTQQTIFIAVLVALASLSKLSGLVLLPFALLGAGWVFVRPRMARYFGGQPAPTQLNWRGFVGFIGIVCGVWIAVAGWWYVRNITLYHELFGTSMMVAVAGPRVGSFGLQTLIDEFQGFRFAYWGLFGAVNIMTYRWFYDVMDIASVLMILGLATAFIAGAESWVKSKTLDNQRLDKCVVGVWLALIVAAGTVSLIGWTAQTYASQGRLLFPFNAAISILGAAGIVNLGRFWIRPLVSRFIEWRKVTSSYLTLPVGFAIFATIVPFASIAPEYTTPLDLGNVPDSARSVYARFGDVALVAYEVTDQRYFPGDNLSITVYWKVIRRSTSDNSLYLHATVNDGIDVGKVDSFPGAGRLRTSTWQVGAIYEDRYSISLDQASEAVSTLRIQVGWWNYVDKRLVNAVDQDGRPLDSVMLDVGGFAPKNTVQRTTGVMPIERVAFGDAVRLVEYQLTGNVLTLVWQATAPLAANYTVFVQALDANNQVVGQGDAPPTLPTKYWLVGEQFVTRHTIGGSAPIGAGSYRVILGWYNSVAGTRLSIAYPDNAYTLPVNFDVPEK